MSQTRQQEQGAAPARVRKDWELFWRIIAGLMLVIIAWIAWVLYQITPRSVATPMAYASQVKPIGTQSSASGAAGTMASPQPTVAAPAAQPTVAAPAAQPTVAAPAAQPTVAAPAAQPTVAAPAAQPTAAMPAAQPGTAAVPQPSPGIAAATLAMDEAQAGARTGAHQSSADVQAEGMEKREEQFKQEEQFRRERLKLSTEITTPFAERKTIPKQQ